LLVVSAVLAPVAAEPLPTPPPPGLLEFLVEWEIGDGEWIDPAELESPDWRDERRDEPAPKPESKQEHDHE